MRHCVAGLYPQEMHLPLAVAPEGQTHPVFVGSPRKAFTSIIGSGTRRLGREGCFTMRFHR